MYSFITILSIFCSKSMKKNQLLFQLSCPAEEFKGKYLGLRRDLHQENAIPMRMADIPDIMLPSSFDWRDHNAVTPVKNQVSSSKNHKQYSIMQSINLFMDLLIIVCVLFRVPVVLVGHLLLLETWKVNMLSIMANFSLFLSKVMCFDICICYTNIF